MKNTVKTSAVLLAAVFVSAALFGEANAQSKKYLVVDISSGCRNALFLKHICGW